MVEIELRDRKEGFVFEGNSVLLLLLLLAETTTPPPATVWGATAARVRQAPRCTKGMAPKYRLDLGNGKGEWV